MTNEEGFSGAVQTLAKNAEELISQNATIDLYEEYFKPKPIDPKMKAADAAKAQQEEDVNIAMEPPSCKTLCVLRDKNTVKRSATSISWHPEDNNKLAVAYSILQFQQMPEKMPLASYIWDVSNPNDKLMELTPQSPITCIVYNPRTPDAIVGGCYNGMLSFWDTRKGSTPVESTVIEQSHHDPVYDVFWIQSRTGNECVSVSTDGQVLWWDWRKTGTPITPTDSMLMQGHNDIVYGGTCMEYKSDAGATRYLVGTEQGVVLMLDRKAKKDKGSEKSIKTVFGEKGGAHVGPIYSVQRNPGQGMLKYFLTVGDWTAKVWNEELKTPIMSTNYDGAYLTGGCWCPTRPGLFYTCKNDGTLDAWDLFFRHSSPAFSTKVSDIGLTSLKVQQSGSMVACGDASGSVTVLSVSNALYELQDYERPAMTEMTERESKREKHIELRQAARKKAEREKPAKETVFDPLEEDDEATKAILNEIEEQFFQQLNVESRKKDGDNAKSGEHSEKSSEAVSVPKSE
jgi:dynein intermediate chain 2